MCKDYLIVGRDQTFFEPLGGGRFRCIHGDWVGYLSGNSLYHDELCEQHIAAYSKVELVSKEEFYKRYSQ